MEFRISTKQKEKLIDSVQRYIDTELKELKEFSEQGDLSYDESSQVDSIDHIKVVNVEKKEGWVIEVDIYKNGGRYSFDDVLYHLHHELKKYIGMNSVNEREIIDVRSSGPGIDW